MKKSYGFWIMGCGLIAVSCWMLMAATTPKPMSFADEITLPSGFKATVFADKLGRARHLTVNTNGDVYVKLDKLKDGKGIMRLRDKNDDGVADDISGFGNFTGTQTGGTILLSRPGNIALFNGIEQVPTEELE